MEVKAGYRQTEVGVIPEDWDFGYLAKYWAVKDCKHITADFVETGIPVASIREVQSKVVDLRNANQTTAFYYNLLIEGGRKPLPGDLIFSRNATVGEVAQVDKSHPLFAMGQDVCILKKRSPEYSTDYLQSVIRSPLIITQLTDLMVGSTFKRVNIEQIRNFLIPMPSPAEQRAIATALSDVDALITSLDKLIAKKRDIKQAAMQRLLYGQIRLPGFKGVWENLFVQDVTTGYFCGPSPTCEERNIANESEWGVLKTTAATKDNGWDWKRHKVLPKIFWNKPHLEVKMGDVIVTKAGPRHRVGVAVWVDYAPPRIIVSGKMIGLHPNSEKAVPLMLAAAISAPEAQLYLNQRTTGMAESQVNFENRALLEAPIILPHIEEQTAIATVLSDMDAELAALGQKRDKTKAIKQGMMQELLTGRIRLV
jgi:type I restriction enzyme, S subunit